MPLCPFRAIWQNHRTLCSSPVKHDFIKLLNCTVCLTHTMKINWRHFCSCTIRLNHTHSKFCHQAIIFKYSNTTCNTSTHNIFAFVEKLFLLLSSPLPLISGKTYTDVDITPQHHTILNFLLQFCPGHLPLSHLGYFCNILFYAVLFRILALHIWGDYLR